MYSRKKVPFNALIKNHDVTSFPLMAYPLRRDFYPPFKFVVHRKVNCIDGVLLESKDSWVVSEVMSGATATSGVGLPTIREAIASARERLGKRTPQEVGVIVAKFMGLA